MASAIDIVPMLDRKLACNHGRAAAMAIFHDLQEITSLLCGDRSESPGVEDQKFDARQALEESAKSANIPLS
jgi:hypothetical protein